MCYFCDIYYVRETPNRKLEKITCSKGLELLIYINLPFPTHISCFSWMFLNLWFYHIVHVLVGIPNLPMYANRGTHKHVHRNRYVCAPFGLDMEPIHANKYTGLFVPYWHTQGAWECNKHTFLCTLGIHRDLGHANKKKFVFFQFKCQTFVFLVIYHLYLSNHNHLTWSIEGAFSNPKSNVGNHVLQFHHRISKFANR